jgi:hypothetical protein
MQRSEQINELVKALADASAEFPKIEKDCTAKVKTKAGGEYSYSYADLNDILSAVRPSLAKHGLVLSHDCVVIQETVEVDGESVKVYSVETTAMLEHSSGQYKHSSPLRIPCDGSMAAAQLVGSGNTYGKRYTAQNILGLSTESDDDGNLASGNDAATGKKAPMPVCPKCNKSNSVIVGKAEYGGGFVCFGKKGGCGHKWQPPAPTLTDEEVSYVAAATSEIIKTETEEELRNVGEQFKGKSEAVKSALRDVYESRIKVIRTKQPESNPA